jgi:hypothetical protein
VSRFRLSTGVSSSCGTAVTGLIMLAMLVGCILNVCRKIWRKLKIDGKLVRRSSSCGRQELMERSKVLGRNSEFLRMMVSYKHPSARGGRMSRASGVAGTIATLPFAIVPDMAKAWYGGRWVAGDCPWYMRGHSRLSLIWPGLRWVGGVLAHFELRLKLVHQGKSQPITRNFLIFV